MNIQPKIEEVQALDGKIFAMLDEYEQHVLDSTQSKEGSSVLPLAS